MDASCSGSDDVATSDGSAPDRPRQYSFPAPRLQMSAAAPIQMPSLPRQHVTQAHSGPLVASHPQQTYTSCQPLTFSSVVHNSGADTPAVWQRARSTPWDDYTNAVDMLTATNMAGPSRRGGQMHDPAPQDSAHARAPGFQEPEQDRHMSNMVRRGQDPIGAVFQGAYSHIPPGPFLHNSQAPAHHMSSSPAQPSTHPNFRSTTSFTLPISVRPLPSPSTAAQRRSSHASHSNRAPTSAHHSGDPYEAAARPQSPFSYSPTGFAPHTESPQQIILPDSLDAQEFQGFLRDLSPAAQRPPFHPPSTEAAQESSLYSGAAASTGRARSRRTTHTSRLSASAAEADQEMPPGAATAKLGVSSEAARWEDDELLACTSETMSPVHKHSKGRGRSVPLGDTLQPDDVATGSIGSDVRAGAGRGTSSLDEPPRQRRVRMMGLSDEMRRDRRRLSNRDSARRSRIRRQEEANWNSEKIASLTEQLQERQDQLDAALEQVEQLQATVRQLEARRGGAG